MWQHIVYASQDTRHVLSAPTARLKRTRLAVNMWWYRARRKSSRVEKVGGCAGEGGGSVRGWRVGRGHPFHPPFSHPPLSHPPQFPSSTIHHFTTHCIACILRGTEPPFIFHPISYFFAMRKATCTGAGLASNEHETRRWPSKHAFMLMEQHNCVLQKPRARRWRRAGRMQLTRQLRFQLPNANTY